jgi:hypothetical protein
MKLSSGKIPYHFFKQFLNCFFQPNTQDKDENSRYLVFRQFQFPVTDGWQRDKFSSTSTGKSNFSFGCQVLIEIHINIDQQYTLAVPKFKYIFKKSSGII